MAFDPRLQQHLIDLLQPRMTPARRTDSPAPGAFAEALSNAEQRSMAGSKEAASVRQLAQLLRLQQLSGSLSLAPDQQDNDWLPAPSWQPPISRLLDTYRQNLDPQPAVPPIAEPPSAPPAAEAEGPGAFDGIIQEAATRFELPEALIRAVIRAESDFQPDTVSHAGAQGLMQLMPETAQDLGVEDPFDPRQNILGGSRYLRQMLDRFGGDLERALAAYNWGPGNVSRSDRYPEETRTYISRVMRYRAEFQG